MGMAGCKYLPLQVFYGKIKEEIFQNNATIVTKLVVVQQKLLKMRRDTVEDKEIVELFLQRNEDAVKYTKQKYNAKSQRNRFI